MFSTFFQPCELKLHLLQNAVFLHPPDRPLPETHDRPPMANDEIVRGLVELYVPSTRHIAGIRVRMKAVQTIAILDPASGLTPISWEDSTIIDKVVEIGIQHHDKDKHAPHGMLNFGSRSVSLGPASHSPAPTSASAQAQRGRSTAAVERSSGRSGSAFGLRSSSPGGSIPASMARAVSRGRRLASGMGRISHSPSPSNSRSNSRATSPAPPNTGERGRSVSTREPPPYSVAVAELSSQPASRSSTASAGTDNEQEVVDHSLPGSQNATPQMSRRQSLAAVRSPADERAHSQPPAQSQPPSYPAISNDSDLAAHLRRSLATHERNERRSSSAAPAAPSPAAGGAYLDLPSPEEERHSKSKSRSSSLGFFASRKAKSKSRAPVSRASGAHATELNQVDEEETRGRRGPMQHSSSSSSDVVISPASENEPGWENEPCQDGLELQKGVHGFEFAFIIPCDAPPYERSPYGRVRWIVKATAIGAGRAKSNVECWRDFYPMVNPSPDSGPTPLTVLYNDMHPTVGLVSIACTSNNISVGGVFNIDINSPNPPQDLIVYLVRVSLETNIEMRTKRKGKQSVPIQRHKLFERGWVPPKNNDGSHGDGKKTDGFIRNAGSDDAWTVQGIARMPDDNTIRASTVQASKASIRFSHVMVVEIVHSRRTELSTTKTREEEIRERRLKVFALRQPVLIPSCCCAYDAVTLPAYSAQPDPSSRSAEMPYDLTRFGYHPPASMTNGAAGVTTGAANASLGGFSTAGPNGRTTSQPVHGNSQLFCVCGMSLQDLSAQERALIPTQPLDVMGGEHFRHQGKIGELPTRLESGSRRRSPSTSSSTSGAGIVASLKGRRRSTSSTRTAVSAAIGSSSGGAAGGSGGSGSGTSSALSERRSSITASIQGRSPSIASAFRARRPSNSSTTAGGSTGKEAATAALKYSGGSAFTRSDSTSRSSAISRISATSNRSAPANNPASSSSSSANSRLRSPSAHRLPTSSSPIKEQIPEEPAK
ncbi:hypothetical protein BCV70DRAFT_155607 [Testicularia cyperi]|uniref:Arrestin C-terminal-like domain-containing protein n=1 Tax=Testicularia cyperi TaxID=1882483 RepID=A0A317XWA1_9BASI|nr:hypothetical protein BCV70DRAFT_155607 [Testicularia cyperi]